MKNKSQMAELEKQQEPKRFQWIKGDNFGEVVELKDEDSTFMNFTNGDRIFKSMKGEFLMEIEGEELPLPGIDKPLFNKGVDTIKGSHNDSPNFTAEISPNKSPQSSPKTPEETPLEQLIIKLSKKNATTLNVPIELNLPRKEIVDLLVDNSEEYDRDTVLSIITETTINKIDINTLRETLKEQINSHLKNYYNE